MVTVALVCVIVGPLCALAMLALLLVGCGPDPQTDDRTVAEYTELRDALGEAVARR